MTCSLAAPGAPGGPGGPGAYSVSPRPMAGPLWLWPWNHGVARMSQVGLSPRPVAGGGGGGVRRLFCLLVSLRVCLCVGVCSRSPDWGVLGLRFRPRRRVHEPNVRSWRAPNAVGKVRERVVDVNAGMVVVVQSESPLGSLGGLRQ